jgi:hypothetical protein
MAKQQEVKKEEEKKEPVKLTTVYLSGQDMFCELGPNLQFSGKFGWHLRAKGGYIEVDILKGN